MELQWKSLGICSWALMSLLALPLIAANNGGEAGLRVLSKEFAAAPDDRRGTRALTLSVRNEAREAITAWKISCLEAESDGNFGVGSLRVDAFLGFENAEMSDESRLYRPIHPGESREVTLSNEGWRPTTPYAAVSCGVVAVVFADGTYSGVTSELNTIFEGRVTSYLEVQKAVGLVREMFEKGLPPAQMPDFVEPQYSELVRSATRSLQSGDAVRLGQTLDTLLETQAQIEKHIPTSWSNMLSPVSKPEGGAQ